MVGGIYMSNMKAKIAGVVAVGAVALAHISGGLRDIEEHVSPTMATWSFDWLKEGNPILEHSLAYAVAEGALSEAFAGSKDDKIAAGAACQFLDTGIEGTQDNQQLVASINQHVPPEDRNNFLVKEEVSNLADKFQGLTMPGSFGYLYRRVCL
jgi:hypothetical protein